MEIPENFREIQVGETFFHLARMDSLDDHFPTPKMVSCRCFSRIVRVVGTHQPVSISQIFASFKQCQCFAPMGCKESLKYTHRFHPLKRPGAGLRLKPAPKEPQDQEPIKRG